MEKLNKVPNIIGKAKDQNIKALLFNNVLNVYLKL